jgi:lipopolysaccharide heptosyltransferase I
VSNLAHQTFSRILLVKPSSLGDVVHALPVLHGLRTRYPEAKIDWLIASPLAPLLASHPHIDELVLFDRERFGRIGRSPRVAGELVRFLHDLRTRRYDLVIDLQGLFRTGFLTWATRAPVRIGFTDAREGAWAFYTHRVRVDDPNMHAVDRNYRIGEFLGCSRDALAFHLPIPDSARAEAQSLLRGCGFPGDERIIAIVPGARWETKRWLPERFVETINLLHGRCAARCVLLGSTQEGSLCERIACACRLRPVNLTGRTSLGQLAALIELADLVLCQDSAAMHLAVALKRPLVCMVGPTNPARTGPYRRMNDVVRLELDCAPCYFRRLSQCPYDHRCMRELEASTVMTAVDTALATAPASRGL